MRNTFLQRYEKELVESAVESAVDSTVKDLKLDYAIAMKEKNISREVIFDITGVDIDKI